MKSKIFYAQIINRPNAKSGRYPMPVSRILCQCSALGLQILTNYFHPNDGQSVKIRINNNLDYL